MTRGILIAAVLLGAAACHRSSPAPSGSAPAAATAAAPLGKGDIEVVVNGKASGAWRAQQIAAAGAIAVTNQNGESREGWPLKRLTQSLVGKQARVVAVASAGERVAIDEKSWNDPARSLMLRLNHHGEYKALWVDGSGNADEAFLKGVRRVEVVQ
ncbi:MAG: hypothetical protein JWM53_6544 [bacterium]|nr:hypothetical protein [bacterium]